MGEETSNGEQRTTRKTIQFFRMLGAREKQHTYPTTADLVAGIKAASAEQLRHEIDGTSSVRCCPMLAEGQAWLVFVYETVANLPHYVESDGTLKDLIDRLGDGRLGYCSFAALFEGGYLGFVQNNSGPGLGQVEYILRKAAGKDFLQKYGPFKLKSLIQRDTQGYVKRLAEVRSLEIKLTPQEQGQMKFMDLGLPDILDDISRESCATTIKLVLKVEEHNPRFKDYVVNALGKVFSGSDGKHKPDALTVEGTLDGELDPRRINLLKEEFKFSETFHLRRPPSRVLDPEEVFEKIGSKFAEMEAEIRGAFLNLS